jgi:hypothetical protein
MRHWYCCSPIHCQRKELPNSELHSIRRRGCQWCGGYPALSCSGRTYSERETWNARIYLNSRQTQIRLRLKFELSRPALDVRALYCPLCFLHSDRDPIRTLECLHIQDYEGPRKVSCEGDIPTDFVRLCQLYYVRDARILWGDYTILLRPHSILLRLLKFESEK